MPISRSRSSVPATRWSSQTRAGSAPQPTGQESGFGAARALSGLGRQLLGRAGEILKREDEVLCGLSRSALSAAVDQRALVEVGVGGEDEEAEGVADDVGLQVPEASRSALAIDRQGGPESRGKRIPCDLPLMAQCVALLDDQRPQPGDPTSGAKRAPRRHG